MRIIVPPVLIGTRICRIVAPVEHLLEVEEWVGEWWEPCALTISEVGAAPRVSEKMLDQRAVPREDRGPNDDRTSASAIQTMMLAHVMLRPENTDVTPSSNITRGPRQKVYSGSRRFGNRRGSQADRRRSGRGENAEQWNGPWRRASDQPSKTEITPKPKKRRRSSTPPEGSDTRV